MALHLSYIARYAPSIQIHILLKTFAQILTIVFKQPLIKHNAVKMFVNTIFSPHCAYILRNSLN